MITAEALDANCLCGCAMPQGATAHAIVAALASDDLDRALELGLLEDIACSGCEASCQARLRDAREARLRALAARERHRAREARLQRRLAERDRQREATRPADRAEAADAASTAPSLPSAAAAALARARAKAAQRHKP